MQLEVPPSLFAGWDWQIICRQGLFNPEQSKEDLAGRGEGEENLQCQ